jgi:Fe2+ or Zn2+ uptake regulation protein
MIHRRTRQQRALEQAVQSLPDLFSLQDLLDVARRQDRNVSRATAYRFLESQVQDARLHRYSCQGRGVYSKTRTCHLHFTCRACFRVHHVDLPDITSIRRVVPGTLSHVQVDAHGLCHRCREAKDRG